jgi:hypothetical protein
MTRAFVSFCTLIWLGGIAASGIAQAPNPVPPQGKASDTKDAEPVLPGISKYRTWGAVNPHRFEVSPMVSWLCRGVTEKEQRERIAAERQVDPHAGAFIRVYVTPTSRSAFVNRKPLPVGTTVVKEKFLSKTGTIPELSTVMVKRKAGFDSKNGNWQYYVLDASGTKILADKRLAYCQDCHRDQNAKDYLFRTYLSGGENNSVSRMGLQYRMGERLKKKNPPPSKSKKGNP